MDRKSFLKLLAKRFYPVLRDEGFKGSGTRLLRIAEPLVHVVNVQGRAGIDGCFINLGANLTFLWPVVAKNTLSGDCAFHARLDPPKDSLPKCWDYGVTESDAHAVIDTLIEHWESDGRAFFDRYATYPDSFERLIRETEFRGMHPYRVLTHAKIARELGQEELARRLVRDALPDVGEGAPVLLRKMQDFLDSTDGGTPESDAAPV